MTSRKNKRRSGVASRVDTTNLEEGMRLTGALSDSNMSIDAALLDMEMALLASPWYWIWMFLCIAAITGGLTYLAWMGLVV